MNDSYPVRLEGRLEEPLSRWLWLVKWLLALPHWFALVFLWIGFVLATAVAFVVLLFGGGYPRRLHAFNVGVLRWTWRVGYYACSALATDRYPPFALADDPDYPARLDVAYPELQRHGLPLIGWWLLGIPQYAIAGILASGTGVRWTSGHASLEVPSLVGILVLVVAVLLLIGRSYPRNVFDLVMGFNRWSLRVCAYAAFLTSEYPPFRLDQGGEEPTGGTPGRAPTPGPAV
ncbi:MAG TPA: DUF4389 domain-containing protein [Gaiellaceae bacterium]|nr:DUF4389 domain-containing protein [Gaiellaceae bacterium]